MINKRYEIIKLLGSGRGKVFSCKDLLTDSVCAIKILPAGAEAYEELLFREEYIVLRQLDHQNIIKSYDFGAVLELDEEDEKYELRSGQSYFTMEFFAGNCLHKSKINNETELLEIFKQILKTLFYLHESNFIYHDLKAENILYNGNKIKFVDFGFIEKYEKGKESNYEPRGTDIYLAPELLTGKEYDKRIDLYSLGVLFYYLIYNEYPFKQGSNIKLYKEKLEGKILFPQTGYSNRFISVIRKLLEVDPDLRYKNVLEIFSDLNLDSNYLLNDWKICKTFALTDAVSEIKNFLLEKTINRILLIEGKNGTGKTAITNELFQNFSGVISVSAEDRNDDEFFANTILRKIFYNKFVFNELDLKTKIVVSELLYEPVQNFYEKLKTVFNVITKSLNFVLILDDFDKYDLFTRNFLESVFPYFIARNFKLVLTVDNYFSNSLKDQNRFKKIQLQEFNAEQVGKLINKTHSELFPRKDITELVLQNSDLTPLSIQIFIQALFDLQAYKIHNNSINLNLTDEQLKLIRRSQIEILKQRIEGLTKKQLNLLELIASFESPASVNTISQFYDLSINEVSKEIEALIGLGLLNRRGNTIAISSVSLKNFLYKNIKEKKQIHISIASKLCKSGNSLPVLECAKQYEKANDFKKALSLYYVEMNNARKRGAINYERNLLEYLLNLPFDNKELKLLKIRLTDVLFILGHSKESFELANKLLETCSGEEEKFNLLYKKADCLVELGKIETGLKLYKELYTAAKSAVQKLKLELSIAKAESYLGNYPESKSICKNILKNKSAEKELIADTYNLLGINRFHLHENLEEILSEFEKANLIYLKLKDYKNLIKTESNIGNLLNILGKNNLAIEHWNKAQEYNLIVGSLDDEMRSLLNYGIYFFQNYDFKTSEKKYRNGLNIANAIGKEHEKGLFLMNLSELNLFLCKYEPAIKLSKQALEIFENLGDNNELGEANYILCLIFYKLGDNRAFYEQLAGYERLIKNTELITTQKHYFDYLELLRFEKTFDFNLVEKKVNRLMMLEEKINNQIFFINLHFYFLRILFRDKHFEKAFNYIQTHDLLKRAKNKSYLLGELYYYLGKIAEVYKSAEISGSMEYYLKSYEILKNLELTELSWKVTFALSERYLERGNIKSALEFINLTKQIIKYLLSQFSDLDLENIFLSQPERKETLIKIERWQQVIK